jgi:putative membrane protein insertion efficiency factor
MTVWRAPAAILSAALVGLVKAYQFVISPWLPKACRYHPSCSEYMILALRKHGPIVGAAKGVGRVCRCNPWGGHGEDWP